MKLQQKIFSLLISLLLAAAGNFLKAQCTSPITTFPYNEGFEITNGNWTVFGTAADWAWGTPTKPVINSAASGSKCWVTGGLTNGFYNDGELSWLQSPCFNFSALPYPYISFKLWWETEGQYDGVNLQYSLDNGISWTQAGNLSDAPNCLDSNWYNSSVRFLGGLGAGTDGWAGNIQSGGGGCQGGGGSGGWRLAKKTMPVLGGKPSVIFRFAFGSGTQCNAFDGFAVDDIKIENAPPNNGNIVSSCIDSNTVAFSFSTPLCPTGFLWDFDDTNSGGNNISTLPTPNHIFSAPGNYSVRLTVDGPGNGSFSTSIPVSILGTGFQIINPIACGGGGGAVRVSVSGGFGPFNYLWNTSPAQTNPTAINLSAGNYYVTITSPGACSVDATIDLVAPIFVLKDTVQQPGCLFPSGKIELKILDGLRPFSFNWLPAVSTDSIATSLLPGLYKVIVKDARNCSETRNYTIATLPQPVVQFSAIRSSNCDGLHLGSAVATAIGGTAPFQFLWKTNPLQTNDTAINLIPGNYSVKITDANGCQTIDSVNIGLTGICDDVFFPNAFTPEGNNKTFGPLGNVIEMTNYAINIYNRFGQLVFTTNNPLQKWDGTYKGSRQNPGTYVWQANYLYKKTIRRLAKGTITLLR